jgi:hypothetical protein
VSASHLRTLGIRRRAADAKPLVAGMDIFPPVLGLELSTRGRANANSSLLFLSKQVWAILAKLEMSRKDVVLQVKGRTHFPFEDSR